jgi:2-polyprenyl-6-methoxyphenol hydroxylase-like FAD-dependent oxidoreductase
VHDVGIIGCGTAGAAAALFLSRAGHRVTVYEAVPEPSAVGAGIMLQPTGMRVLERLGLLEPVLARGDRVDRLHCLTREGRDVIDLRYADVHEGAYGLGLHRGVLFEVLFGQVRKERIELRLGEPIDGLRMRAGKRVVIGRHGLEVGAHDLVVVADGARSQPRREAAVMDRAKQYPWGALWFIGEDYAGDFEGTLYQKVDGAQQMLGLLPSGLGPEGTVPRVSLFWSIRADRVEAWRDAGLEPWLAQLAELEPRAEPVLAQITDPAQVLFARYWDVVLRPWHAPGLVFLGDAAHATSPQLGQGANLALVDAMALAEAMEGSDSLKEALRRYSEKRRAHLRYYQWATRFLTPFFQSDSRSLGWLRDTFMGRACKMPFLRSKMVRTMCGLERGILFADPLPMPEAFG